MGAIGTLVRNPHEDESPLDVTNFSMQYTDDGTGMWAGDGSRWVFDLTTVQPDITIMELVEILSLRMEVVDGLMRRFKSNPNLLRHFRQEV